jgi:hypothetical protein
MYILFGAIIILLVITGLAIRSGGRAPNTAPATVSEVQGTFTLFLYGSNASGELASVAILDREDDPYTMSIDAPDFSYSVQPGLSASEAIQKAERFVMRHIQVDRIRLHKVLSPAGAGIGFELKPLYPVTSFGRADIIDVRYMIRDRKVTVRIALDPAVEKQPTN